MTSTGRVTCPLRGLCVEWKAILIGSAALILAAAAPPPPTAVERHAALKKYGTEACFLRLSRGAAEVGSTIIQAGTNATDLCGCVGELFATGFISSAVDQTKFDALDTSRDSPATKLFDNFNSLCIGRLRDHIAK